MRESRTYGSVRGALSNERPYRDRARRWFNGHTAFRAFAHAQTPRPIDRVGKGVQHRAPTETPVRRLCPPLYGA